MVYVVTHSWKLKILLLSELVLNNVFHGLSKVGKNDVKYIFVVHFEFPCFDFECT